MPAMQEAADEEQPLASARLPLLAVPFLPHDGPSRQEVDQNSKMITSAITLGNNVFRTTVRRDEGHLKH